MIDFLFPPKDEKIQNIVIEKNVDFYEIYQVKEEIGRLVIVQGNKVNVDEYLISLKNILASFNSKS